MVFVYSYLFLPLAADFLIFSYKDFEVFYALIVASRSHQPLSRTLGVFSSKALFCGRVLKRPAMSANG